MDADGKPQTDDADRRALAALAELGRKGIPPLDDQHWMNPDDKAAICEPFAAAIRAAVEAEWAACAELAEAEQARAVREAVAGERDRCARIAEAVREDNRAGVADGERGSDAYEAGAFIAARIREGAQP